jgi:hypothetical protein
MACLHCQQRVDALSEGHDLSRNGVRRFRIDGSDQGGHGANEKKVDESGHDPRSVPRVPVAFHSFDDRA